MQPFTFVPSAEQIKRIAREWSIMAQEPVTVEIIGQNIYASGSELACLRLYYKFRCLSVGNEDAEVKYSINTKTYYFRKTAKG